MTVTLPMWSFLLLVYFAIMGIYSIYQAIPRNGKSQERKYPRPSSSALCYGEIIDSGITMKPGTQYGYETVPIRFDTTGRTVKVVCIDNETIASFIVPKDQVSNSEGARYVAHNAMANQHISVIQQQKCRISESLSS